MNLPVPVLACCMLVALAACDGGPQRTALLQATGGDPERGRKALAAYGCGTCHEISGVTGARGRVGPPLDGVSQRWYLGGRVENTPHNMARWIRDPKRFDPGTAMPRLGVSEADARDMVAYLYLEAGR